MEAAHTTSLTKRTGSFTATVALVPGSLLDRIQTPTAASGAASAVLPIHLKTPRAADGDDAAVAAQRCWKLVPNILLYVRGEAAGDNCSVLYNDSVWRSSPAERLIGMPCT